MRILAIDGGGIRGIIPGQLLVALEAKLQQLSNKPDMRLADAFDLIAGTSTGGILTCIYLMPDSHSRRPKFSAQEAVDLYLQNGDNIFDVSVFKSIESVGGIADEKYSASPLENVLKSYLGDAKLSDLLLPCLITAYDITRREARFFNSADVNQLNLGPGRDFYLRDVARATSAAPTYFEPANIVAFDMKVYPLIDGGVFANNPTMCAFVEAFKLRPNLKMTDVRVLSLGTGAADRPFHYSEAKNWGKVGWAIPVLDILMSGVAETVDYQLKTLFESIGCSDQYLRLQVDLEKFPDVDGAMDNASEDNMRALKKVGTDLAITTDAQLTAFAKAILGIPA
jgi:patatin-like phospholipase/acyl hydrolase